jgi:endonuclease/exonuclease/phosphatase family metal-dependent hydrolase
MYTNFRRSWLVGLIFTALLAASGSPPAFADWVAPKDYALYIRNNTLKPWYFDFINLYSTAALDCPSTNIIYPLGDGSSSDKTLAAGSMTAILDLTRSESGSTRQGPYYTDCAVNTWFFGFYYWMDLFGTQYKLLHNAYFSDGKFSSTDAASLKDYGFEVVGDIPVYYRGRNYLHDTGSYVTVGLDYFGELGPTRTGSTDNTLTVTAFNAHMGDSDGSRDEQCERGIYYQKVLASLSTDVLLLQEMNYNSAYCSTDAHDLISYLWTGNADETFVNHSYAKGDNGQGVSPQMGGVFPYVSQMVEGASTDYYEDRTGGSIILSKYPLSMIYNERWTGAADVGEGQKGFIIVKVTKNSKDYYIVNTHLSCCDNTARRAQLLQISSKLNTLPSGARMIYGGDLNAGLSDSAKDSSYPNDHWKVYDPLDGGYSGSWIMSKQINTAYYPYSRDGRKVFYGAGTDVKNIDWVVPIQKRPDSTASFTVPTSYKWWVHPMRYVPFAFADLSDHFAVTAVFGY